MSEDCCPSDKRRTYEWPHILTSTWGDHQKRNLFSDRFKNGTDIPSRSRKVRRWNNLFVPLCYILPPVDVLFRKGITKHNIFFRSCHTRYSPGPCHCPTGPVIF